jgi:hypothetical protein
MTLPEPLVPCDALPGFALSHAIGRNAFLRSDQNRVAHDEPDRRKVLEQIVLQRIDSAVGDVSGPVALHERVAVGRCPSDAADADAARSARYVFDNDGLAQ